MCLRCCGSHQVGNVEKLEDIEWDKKFDIVFAGELIEHLNNPGLFLRGVKSCLKEHGELIITTPNAFAIRRIPRLLWRNEVQHPDHTFCFSYSTLATLFTRAKFQIVDFVVYYEGEDLSLNKKRVSKLVNLFLRKMEIFNWYADGFILKAKSD